jgi:uroporphyrinogen III methyltransferase/synthase
MMGTEHIRQVSDVLQKHGMSPDMPVAMVSWGTLGRQRTIVGTLSTIAGLAEDTQLSPPSITVIGEVVNLRTHLNWFEKLPLFGQRIVVTRSKLQAPELVHHLTAHGAEVLQIPCIRTAPPSDLNPLKDAIVGLHEYDWLVFTSPNGVRTFFDYFDRGFEDARDIGGVRIAAVGPGTATALHDRRLKVNVVPKQATAVHVAKAIMADGDVENLRICILRAETANPELPQLLEEKGAIVDDIPVYRTVAEAVEPSADADHLNQQGADWLTFTSGSTVEHFHARFDLPDLLRRFPQLRVASIGPETSKGIRALGLEPALEAREHTIDGLVKSLQKHAPRTTQNKPRQAHGDS